jgi:hypothetical protein
MGLIVTRRGGKRLVQAGLDLRHVDDVIAVGSEDMRALIDRERAGPLSPAPQSPRGRFEPSGRQGHSSTAPSRR